MTKLYLFALMFLCFTPGCCFLEKKTDHSFQSGVEVNVANSQFDHVHINKRDGFFYVEGTVHKRPGKDLSKTNVVIQFMNEQGQVLNENRDSITPVRLHTNKGRTGHFNVKMPYNENVKVCKLVLE